MQGSLGGIGAIKWRARINLIEWGLRRLTRLRNNSNRYNLARRKECFIGGRAVAGYLGIGKNGSLH